MADYVITSSGVRQPTLNCSVDRGNVAGANITAGQSCYQDGSRTWWPAQSNSSGSALSNTLGVAVNSAAAGQPVDMAIRGTVILGTSVTNFRAGQVAVVSVNPGNICLNSDITVGNLLAILGVTFVDTNGNQCIQLLPNNTGVTVA